jgi:membrane-bound serine protease (ClpP class)
MSRVRLFFLPLLAAGAVALPGVSSGLNAQDQPKEPPAARGSAFRFVVPLPLTGSADTQLQARIERALKQLPANSAVRPTIILEFSPGEGAGSDFSRAHSLARFLSGPALAGARVVAFVTTPVRGHTVLPILACEQIVMAKESELGDAGADEVGADPVVREAYLAVANRRRTVPPAVALGMLDQGLSVVKATTPQGVRYLTPDELAKLRDEGAISREETLFRAGEAHLLTGAEMRTHGFATHLAADLPALSAALHLPSGALLSSAEPEEGWKAVRIDLDGPINNQRVSRVRRMIEDRRQRDDFNLLCVFVNSPGGDIAESLALAAYLAELGPEIRTVAVVEKQALGDAVAIVWACDEAVVWPDARLGGPGEQAIRAQQRELLREPLEQIGRLKGRTWSLTAGLIDGVTEVFACKHQTNEETRYYSVVERESQPDQGEWKQAGPALDIVRGVDGRTALELALAQHQVQNHGEFRTLYRLEGDLRSMRPNAVLEAVEFLADPRIAGLLLFIAWFALMIELSTPGIGAPGFISALCFMLYFWAQFLHGTAGWLEILLFAGGLICIGIEIFALPGVGIFGIGGACMVIVSIVLASQTFVFPANAYQLRQFPVSLLMVGAAFAGGVTAIGVIRRYLPDTPYFNRMMLKPPQGEELDALSERESLVNWAHLAGKRGIAMTQLVPAGRVQIGDEIVDVVSDGNLIPRGAAVVVSEVLGSRVVVRRADA